VRIIDILARNPRLSRLFSILDLFIQK